MPSVCFYFQVHQPERLRRYSFLSPGDVDRYFDDEENSRIMKRVADKCYLPMNSLLLELINRYQGKFRCSFSITGTAIEQMERFAPEVLESFQRLVATGCVELLGETYYHSLAAVYDTEEFSAQVAAHKKLLKTHFDYSPKVFRNTELIYSDQIGALVASLGFEGVIAEGADDIMQWRSPNYVYSVSGHSEVRLLAKNYRLSDDVAFRFSNQGWSEWPLTADRYAQWIHKVSGNGDVVNLFMDYETFGEHQWASTGIFEFMRALPEFIFRAPDWNFATPSEVIERYPSRGELSYQRLTSWADIDRDLTAWVGNEMQRSAMADAYALAAAVKGSCSQELLATWRRLLTSDHFYYICTKWFADGDVHAYFSPYESPYEAFINYMNVLKAFRKRLGLKPYQMVAANAA